MDVVQPADLDASVRVHRLALCESNSVGGNTRIWAYAHVLEGAVIGASCNIGDHAFVEGGAVIGDRVTIKNGVLIWDGVTIEDEVFVGPGVIFTNDRRPRSPRMPQVAKRYAQRENWLATTRIGRGATLGAGAIVVAGVSIGAYAFVAAGSLVTHDVPDYQFVMGSPARPHGYVCQCAGALNELLCCTECGMTYRQAERGLTVVEYAGV